jgi:cell division protein FtsL
MSRRIEIELTSKREDGTWTWRAAGALQPKGVVDDAVVPSGVAVTDVVRAEVESDLDGTRVLSIAPPKQKAERSGLLEILPSAKPFEPVTQQLRKKGPRDGDKRRKGAPKDRSEKGPRTEGKDRPRRQFFEAPPEMPQRPKPKRIKARRVNVDAVLVELPEAHRTIAEKVLNGGVPAVRTAIEEQNKEAVAQGREKIPAEGLIQIAEQLLPRLRIAEWRDRALGAESIIEEVDLRDLRSLVVSAEQLVAIDEDTRALVAKMKQALVVRQETEIRLWLEDISTATKVGRVVRALRLSSQPPKAGVPFPAALATQLVDATVAGLTPDAPAERWITLLEAAAFSPVHGKILPPGVPGVVSDDLLKTVTRLGPLMPQLAVLFGVSVDPKARAPRPLPMARAVRPKKKTASQVNQSADAGTTQESSAE